MDKKELTVAEITQMAVTMEEKGMNFYNWASGQFEDKGVKEMFRRLAEEEKEHARTFKKLLNVPGSETKIKPEAARYFSSLAGRDGVFPRHEEIERANITTPADALKYGIEAEKDSILFYHEMYNKLESKEVKEALSKLLEQEKMHLLELRDIMTELTYQ